MKHSASPCWGFPPNPRHGYFLDLAGPGVGGGSGRAPKPLPALPFLNARKGSKRSFKGTAVPLKIPCWGALWPRPQTPRPGSLVVTVSLLRAKGCVLLAGKTLLFVNLCCYRTTARQAVSLISGAIGLDVSECNLSLFRPNRAGRDSSRVGLRSTMLTRVDP